MYASTIAACRRSLSFQTSRNFATTICILAGSQSHDCVGAKLMRKIKEQSNDEVRFIGIGGPEMLDEGLERSYANINLFQDKPLVPYKNHLRKHINQVFHPVMFWLRHANRAVAAEMTKNNFWSEVWEAKPNAYLTLGNEFFMKTTYQEITGIYQNNDTLKPPLIHYDNLIHNQRQEYQSYVDYWLYAVPKEPVNWSYFKFPSTYVGSYAASRAIRYLYNASPNAKHLLRDNGFLLCKEYNTAIMDSLLEDERARFREKNGISEDTTLFYGLPGNTESEIKWAVPIICGTVDVFLKKFPQYSSDNFAVVVTSYPRLEDFTQNEIDKQNWPCKVIVTRTEDEKYSALAASDMGAVVNGDAVSECAAYHVPIVILNKFTFFQGYMTLLYNSFANNLNIALNGEAYPESIGQTFPEKIAEYWKEWFQTPSKKFDVINRFENLVLQLVPEEGERVQEAIDTKALVDDAAPFTRYYDSEYLAAKKILEATEVYSSYVARQPKRFELEKTRNEMLTQFCGKYFFNY